MVPISRVYGGGGRVLLFVVGFSALAIHWVPLWWGHLAGFLFGFVWKGFCEGGPESPPHIIFPLFCVFGVYICLVCVWFPLIVFVSWGWLVYNASSRFRGGKGKVNFALIPNSVVFVWGGVCCITLFMLCFPLPFHLC